MRSVTTADLQELLKPHEPPCVSIYLPTERTYPAEQQNAIRYRNLLTQVEASLRQHYPGSRVQRLLEPFLVPVGDEHFWTHRLDGLALFGSADGFFRTLELQRRVPERAIVADSFHVKPLVRITQSADRFQVLGVTRNHARLWEGTRDVLDEVELLGVPVQFAQGPGTQGVQRLPAAMAATVAAGQRAAQPDDYGQPTRGDEAKREGELFMWAVDQAVWQHHSSVARLPLVLVALPVNQSAFRAVSKNQYLLPEGIERDPDSLSADQLREAAWQVLLPRYLARLEKFADDFRTARARGRGSDDVAAVAEAAHNGRVGVLLIDADRQVPGRLDPATGRPAAADLARPDVDDLLDDLAERVLATDGTVVVAPTERMPTTTGLAAIYRF